MPTLGTFLAGLGAGTSRAVETLSRLQTLLTNAERMRMERQLFPYRVELTKAQAESEKTRAESERMQLEGLRREQEALRRPIYLTPQATQVPQAPTTDEVVKQAVSIATQQQLTRPIDIKEIEVSGIVPKETIQTIISDPVLSQIAVQKDETGRPYTTLFNIQLLDKVLASTSAIESGLTGKVVRSTVQGLSRELDKLYGELEKLYENPEKNKDKIQQVVSKIQITKGRMDAAIQYGLSTDLKQLANYYMKWENLDEKQRYHAQQLEQKLTQLGFQLQMQQMKNNIEIWKEMQRLKEKEKDREEKLKREEGKQFLGTPKPKKFLLNDGTVVSGTVGISRSGRKVYLDSRGREIDPDSVYGVYDEGDVVGLETGRATLGTRQGKEKVPKPKEPRIEFLDKGKPSGRTRSPEYIIE